MIDSGSIWIGEQIIDGNIDLDWPGDVAHRTTLRAVARGRAGRHTLEGRSRGAFSGGEIQRLRRLRQEGHTP